MDPTIVAAMIGAVGVVIAAVIGLLARRNGRQGSSPASGTAGPNIGQPPFVIETNPLDRAIDVPPNIHLAAIFSKDMDSGSINPDHFKLLDQVSFAQVQPRFPDGVVYDVATRAATFTPAQDLENGRTYAVVITAGVRDLEGIRMVEDHSWHFTIHP
jgi:Bacterial Ig-like domain